MKILIENILTDEELMAINGGIKETSEVTAAGRMGQVNCCNSTTGGTNGNDN